LLDFYYKYFDYIFFTKNENKKKSTLADHCVKVYISMIENDISLCQDLRVGSAWVNIIYTIIMFYGKLYFRFLPVLIIKHLSNIDYFT